jgi:hypothetical protein
MPAPLPVAVFKTNPDRCLCSWIMTLKLVCIERYIVRSLGVSKSSWQLWRSRSNSSGMMKKSQFNQGWAPDSYPYRVPNKSVWRPVCAGLNSNAVSFFSKDQKRKMWRIRKREKDLFSSCSVFVTRRRRSHFKKIDWQGTQVSNY